MYKQPVFDKSWFFIDLPSKNEKKESPVENEYVPDLIPQGKLDNAVRRALNILDAWNKVTGVVQIHSSYYYELQGVIEAAVECGIQATLDQYTPLGCEEEFLLEDTIPD